MGFRNKLCSIYELLSSPFRVKMYTYIIKVHYNFRNISSYISSLLLENLRCSNIINPFSCPVINMIVSNMLVFKNVNEVASITWGLTAQHHLDGLITGQELSLHFAASETWFYLYIGIIEFYTWTLNSYFRLIIHFLF